MSAINISFKVSTFFLNTCRHQSSSGSTKRKSQPNIYILCVRPEVYLDYFWRHAGHRTFGEFELINMLRSFTVDRYLVSCPVNKGYLCDLPSAAHKEILHLVSL